MPITVETNYAAIMGAIKGWLETYAGLGAGKVMWLNQETERLQKPYGTLYVVSDGVAFGNDEARDAFNAGTNKLDRQTTGPRQMVVQAEVYSDPATAAGQFEARHRLLNALQALELGVVMDSMGSAGLSYLGHEAVNELDEQLGDRWERRAQVDITFLYTASTLQDGTDAVQWIETVEVPQEGSGLIVNQ